jgi:acetyl/propionyl-CoA carboxylase alpha subunit
MFDKVLIANRGEIGRASRQLPSPVRTPNAADTD